MRKLPQMGFVREKMNFRFRQIRSEPTGWHYEFAAGRFVLMDAA